MTDISFFPFELEASVIVKKIIDQKVVEGVLVKGDVFKTKMAIFQGMVKFYCYSIENKLLLSYSFDLLEKKSEPGVFYYQHLKKNLGEVTI
jgi:hypothetical protein